jgi:type VI protein secretion system component VasK
MLRTKRDDDDAERAAKGLLSGWWTAKTTTWFARLTVWGMWLAAFAAYGGYVWWRVRRMLKADQQADQKAEKPYGLEVRSSSESQQPSRSPAPQ